VHSAPIAPALFVDRWASVEEARRSGTFKDGEAQEDAKAATIILDARKKAIEDIRAGRTAPYYLAPPMTPSRATPSPLLTNSGGAVKK
jgi:hypothetical protein